MGNLCAPAAAEEESLPPTAGPFLQQLPFRKSHDLSHAAQYKRQLMNMHSRAMADAKLELAAHDGIAFSSLYKELKTIGAGAAAKVVLCEHLQTGEKYAVKLLPKMADLVKQKEGLVKKIAIMKLLQTHPNMIKFYGIYEEKEHFCVVLEWCAGGPLFDHLMSKGHFSEKEASAIMRCILNFLQYAHAKGIMHRDLKPENLMLAEQGNETSLRVIDYGTAEFCLDGQVLTERIGTPYYVAPEILTQHYNRSADIWSAGVIMYILLCGYPPFAGTAEVTLSRVSKGRYAFDGEEWSEVTQDAKNMIGVMLVKDLEKRWTAEQLLTHVWFDTATKTQSLGSRMIGRLRAFVRLNRLKRLAMVVLARTIADVDVSRIREEFMGLEADSHSQRVGLDGLQRALANLGMALDPDELHTLFDAADFDHTGNISPEEFIAAVLVTSRMGRQKDGDRTSMVKESFNMLDHDHDGFITPEDLIYVLPQGTSLDEARQMIVEIDTTGKVNYQEFATLMQPQGLVELLTYHSLLTGVKLDGPVPSSTSRPSTAEGELQTVSFSRKLAAGLQSATDPSLPLMPLPPNSASEQMFMQRSELERLLFQSTSALDGLSRSASTPMLSTPAPVTPNAAIPAAYLRQPSYEVASARDDVPESTFDGDYDESGRRLSSVDVGRRRSYLRGSSVDNDGIGAREYAFEDGEESQDIRMPSFEGVRPSSDMRVLSFDGAQAGDASGEPAAAKPNDDVRQLSFDVIKGADSMRVSSFEGAWGGEYARQPSQDGTWAVEDGGQSSSPENARAGSDVRQPSFAAVDSDYVHQLRHGGAWDGEDVVHPTPAAEDAHQLPAEAGAHLQRTSTGAAQADEGVRLSSFVIARVDPPPPAHARPRPAPSDVRLSSFVGAAVDGDVRLSSFVAGPAGTHVHHAVVEDPEARAASFAGAVVSTGVQQGSSAGAVDGQDTRLSSFVRASVAELLDSTKEDHGVTKEDHDMQHDSPAARTASGDGRDVLETMPGDGTGDVMEPAAVFVTGKHNGHDAQHSVPDAAARSDDGQAALSNTPLPHTPMSHTPDLRIPSYNATIEMRTPLPDLAGLSQDPPRVSPPGSDHALHLSHLSDDGAAIHHDAQERAAASDSDNLSADGASNGDNVQAPILEGKGAGYDEQPSPAESRVHHAHASEPAREGVSDPENIRQPSLVDAMAGTDVRGPPLHAEPPTEAMHQLLFDGTRAFEDVRTSPDGSTKDSTEAQQLLIACARAGEELRQASKSFDSTRGGEHLREAAFGNANRGDDVRLTSFGEGEEPGQASKSDGSALEGEHLREAAFGNASRGDDVRLTSFGEGEEPQVPYAGTKGHEDDARGDKDDARGDKDGARCDEDNDRGDEEDARSDAELRRLSSDTARAVDELLRQSFARSRGNAELQQ